MPSIFTSTRNTHPTFYTNQDIKIICLNLIKNTIKIQSELENLNTYSHNLSSMPHVINPLKEILQSKLTQLTNRLNMFFNLFGYTLDLSNTNLTDDELKTLINTISEQTLTQIKNINLEGCSGLTALPDLSKLTKLQEVSLAECSRLTNDGNQALQEQCPNLRIYR